MLNADKHVSSGQFFIHKFMSKETNKSKAPSISLSILNPSLFKNNFYEY